MRRIPLLLTAAAAFLPLGAAAPAIAAANSLFVSTIGHKGAYVPTTVQLLNLSSYQRYTARSGKRTSLPSGRYAVIASILEGTDTATLAGRIVKVSGRTSVTLDGRGGRPVRVSLSGPVPAGLSQRIDARICAGRQGWIQQEVITSPGYLFVVPDSSRDLQFAYESDWTGGSTLSPDNYLVTGQTTSGLPSHPGGRFRTSSLATVGVHLRGPSTTTIMSLEVQPDPGTTPSCESRLAGSSVVNWQNPPIDFTAHISAGQWAFTTFMSGGGSKGTTRTFNPAKNYSIALKVT